MTRAWPVQPGIPAAGHVTSRGYWHPGQIEGCVKCEPPSTSRFCRFCQARPGQPCRDSEGNPTRPHSDRTRLR